MDRGGYVFVANVFERGRDRPHARHVLEVVGDVALDEIRDNVLDGPKTETTHVHVRLHRTSLVVHFAHLHSGPETQFRDGVQLAHERVVHVDPAAVRVEDELGVGVRRAVLVKVDEHLRDAVGAQESVEAVAVLVVSQIVVEEGEVVVAAQRLDQYSALLDASIGRHWDVAARHEQLERGVDVFVPRNSKVYFVDECGRRRDEDQFQRFVGLAVHEGDVVHAVHEDAPQLEEVGDHGPDLLRAEFRGNRERVQKVDAHTHPARRGPEHARDLGLIDLVLPQHAHVQRGGDADLAPLAVFQTRERYCSQSGNVLCAAVEVPACLAGVGVGCTHVQQVVDRAVGGHADGVVGHGYGFSGV